MLSHCAVGYTNQAVAVLRSLNLIEAVTKALLQSGTATELVVVPTASVVAYNMPYKRAGAASSSSSSSSDALFHHLPPSLVRVRHQMRGDGLYSKQQSQWHAPGSVKLSFSGDPIELRQLAPFCALFDVQHFAATAERLTASIIDSNADSRRLHVTTLAYSPQWLPSEQQQRFAVPRMRASVTDADAYAATAEATPQLYEGLDLIRGDSAWADCNDIHKCRGSWPPVKPNDPKPKWPTVAEWGTTLAQAVTGPNVAEHAVGVPCMFWCLGEARGVYDLGAARQHARAVRLPSHLVAVATQIVEGLQAMLPPDAPLVPGNGGSVDLGNFVGLHLRREPDMCMSMDGKGTINPQAVWCLLTMQDITDELLGTGTQGNVPLPPPPVAAIVSSLTPPPPHPHQVCPQAASSMCRQAWRCTACPTLSSGAVLLHSRS